MFKWTPVVAMLAPLLLLVALAADGPLSTPREAEAVDTVTTVRWGPYTAPGFGDFSQFLGNLQRPCTDCYITGVAPDLVYWDGDPGHPSTDANFDTGPMLHHFVIFNNARIDATCGAVVDVPDRFLASGNERNGMSLPAGYGYYIPPLATPNSTWDAQIHLHNTSVNPQTVYVEVAFSHRPGTDSVKDVRTVWLDQYNCPGDSQYEVGTGYTDSHWEWTVPSTGVQRIEGAIVAIGGHVHDYGISVAVEKVGTGQWICTSTAGYRSSEPNSDPAAVASPPRPSNAGHPPDDIAITPGDGAYVGHIEEMSSCLSPSASIAPGDVLRLHTQYNNGTAGSILDVMGIMTAYVFDNCAAVDNPTQLDTDGDFQGDACDTDDDNDSLGLTANQTTGSCTTGGVPLPRFRDCIETYVGTDPLDACANTSAGDDEPKDKSPGDLNDDQRINVVDRARVVLAIKQFNAVPPVYTQRADLNADSKLDVLDRAAIVLYVKTTAGAFCTP